MFKMNLPEQVRRSSLGRIANIGELYDVRTESPSSQSLFKRSFPPDLIQLADVNEMVFNYKFTENLSDRFELIDVEAELQANILLGLIQLEGSGKFLKSEKKSEKSVSCSLMCRIQTVQEKLFTSIDEIIEHVDLQCLESSTYTHLITEITWGANCLMNLEIACASATDKEEIRGLLAAEFTKLKVVSISGGGNLEKENSKSLNGLDMRIIVFADVLPEKDWPTTPESFFDFVKSVPKLLAKVNNGKGKPLNFGMIPLSTIRKWAKLEVDVDNFVRKIDESFLMSIIYFFEDVGKIKQKLYDLCALLSERNNYVKDEDLGQARSMKEKLIVEEFSLKDCISKEWMLVRSGKKTLKELIKETETLKNRTLNLYNYEAYLESCSPIIEKLSTIKKYISQGIIYLGKGETFQNLQANFPTHEFIVLVTSTEVENANPELSRKTSLYFLTLAADEGPKTKYVVIDFDLVGGREFVSCEINTTRCFHLKGTIVVNKDVFGSYVLEMATNYAVPKAAAEFQLCDHKPGNRVLLEMVCPGFEAHHCPNETLTWFCYKCKASIEYGFDDYYYCGCGKNPATAFDYRCANPRHGVDPIPARNDFLKAALSKLRPLKEMNVLVIGQSGVGKSTWINSIINYLTYENLEDAKENGVICTIPISFTMYDPKTYEKHTIVVGNKCENEVTEAGEAATQHARTYSFLWEGRCVRIIDTPGLGDNRGIAQDKKNLMYIIDHIGYLKELHGVCILLNANDNRLNAIFTYCIIELLTHLHRSVTRNIVFCFTNSRNSMYAPGKAAVVLEKVIERVGVQTEIRLGRHNMFPMDNEAFIFLCTLNHEGIHHDEEVKASYEDSWKVSMSATKRLFNTVKTFEPHFLKETITLVTARNRVLSLTKPLAEISKTIQINISTIERKEKEIEESEMTLKDLEKKLQFTEIDLVPETLKLPRTVCTSSSCVEYLTFRGTDVTDIEYKTHCHPECYLKRVTPKTVNNAQLKECQAMSGGVCKVCGCGYEMHMHLTYSQKRVPKVKENKTVKEDMEKEKEGMSKIEEFSKFLRTRVDNYKREQKQIIDATVKFGMFLRQNAITVYNDSVADYLEYLIEEEEKKPYKSDVEKKILKNLKDTFDRYNEEVKVLQDVLKKSENEVEKISLQDVYELEKGLYEMELTGESIKKFVEESRRSTGRAVEYSEVPIQLGKNCNIMRKRNRVTEGESGKKRWGKSAIERMKGYFLG